MALVVDTYSLGPIQTNCYVVRSERGAAEAAVIDPGADASQLRLELAQMSTSCAAILITHGHYDHLGGVADLAEGTGAPVYMPEGERLLLEQYRDYAPAAFPGRPYTPDHLLVGGETVGVAGIDFEVVAIPGHSPAHIAYYADGCLFSGDLLFAGSVGRVDIPGGDWDRLLASVRMLGERYDRDTVVYPGHGPETTLGHELDRNPFLAELRARPGESGAVSRPGGGGSGSADDASSPAVSRPGGGSGSADDASSPAVSRPGGGGSADDASSPAAR